MEEVRVLLSLQNSHIFFYQTLKLLVNQEDFYFTCLLSQRILLLEDSEGKVVGPRTMFVWFALKNKSVMSIISYNMHLSG